MVNIAIPNELSTCYDLGGDVWDVADIDDGYRRANIRRPEPGLGRQPAAVDPCFMMHSAPERAPLIRTGQKVKAPKAHDVLERARALISEYQYTWRDLNAQSLQVGQ
jgi:UDP-N-acetyl-D-mannosaminuronic acid dehydrogenase